MVHIDLAGSPHVYGNASNTLMCPCFISTYESSSVIKKRNYF